LEVGLQPVSEFGSAAKADISKDTSNGNRLSFTALTKSRFMQQTKINPVPESVILQSKSRIYHFKSMT
jgi:hypothetical protein